MTPNVLSCEAYATCRENQCFLHTGAPPRDQTNGDQMQNRKLRVEKTREREKHLPRYWWEENGENMDRWYR